LLDRHRVERISRDRFEVLPPLFSEEAQLLESFDIPLFGTQFSSTLIFDTAIFLLVGGGALSYIVSSREVEP
jgi:hypothetical protein